MIERVVVQNYRALREADITFAPGRTIVVGDNESGKSTLLEAIHMALTGRIGRRSVRYQLHPWMFNTEVAREFAVAVSAGEKSAPPAILIEVYFTDADELAYLGGANNSKKLDQPGVYIRIVLDKECADDYAEYVGRGDGMSDIPIEYFTVEWYSFANEVMTTRRLPFRAHLVDASALSLHRGANGYLMEIIEGHLTSGQRVDLAVAYRQLRAAFREEDGVRKINEELGRRTDAYSAKTLSVGTDSVSDGSWVEGLLPHLDGIPMPLVGRGEQSASKIWMAMHAAEADVFLIEEPENHLSFTRLHTLIERLARKAGERQLIVSTHSSFVINKLGLDETVLFRLGASTRLSALPSATRDYFRKLPGHDTLRLILSRRAILVEGPSDELVVMKAYQRHHQKTPLEDGVDVISVRSLAFKRFLDIARLVGVPTAVVTDNDGKPESVEETYAEYSDDPSIDICYSGNASLSTLEPQMVASNGWEKIRTVLGTRHGTPEELLHWMASNKTEAALRIFDTTEELTFPEYILRAVR